MINVTLKNIPEKLYDDLKAEAKTNHRSLNGEILFALQLHLGRKKKPNSQEFIAKARAFRNQIKGRLTAEEIEKAINEGRP
jgi:antitoxin FitA